MAKYFLTYKAVEYLSEIWDYTYENCSEKQADIYYQNLLQAIEQISENPEKGRNYIEITHEIIGFNINKHIIFYRLTKPNEIEVLRILHEQMDLRNRITD